MTAKLIDVSGLGNPRRAPRIGSGEGPEAVERGFEIVAELERIEPVIEHLERVPLVGGQDAGGTEPLVRRARAIVDTVSAGPRRRQQAGEGGATGRAEPLGDGGGHRQCAALHEAVEEVGHEGVEAMGADPPARLPQHFGDAGDRGAVLARAAARPGRGPRRAAERPDGRLAMDADYDHDFV